MYYYSLRIATSDEMKIELINNILGMKPACIKREWEIEVSNGSEDPPFNFIDYFLSILDGKYEQLEEIGIARGNITIWMLYECENQCNMEFFSKDLFKLGEEGIALCISCWEK